MKDAKGHGSGSKGTLAAHQEGTVSAIPTAAGLDAMIGRLRSGVMPGLSTSKAPAWVEWFGQAARRARSGK